MPTDVEIAVERAYRAHWGEVTALLSRRFGAGQLDLVESVVQEAFVKALERWPVEGMPANPVAWLLTVAKNLRIDQTRRQARVTKAEEPVARHLQQVADHAAASDLPALASEIADDQLRMMFVCNHPAVPEDARISLTLRTLCGFQPIQLARAHLISEDALKKRLVRARAALRDAAVDVDLPGAAELGARLDSVLATLYLLFGEGYAPHDGDHHIRQELATDAIRLVELLASHPLTRAPRVHALLALMCIHGSRFAARIDGEGLPVALADQDRTRWDLPLIRKGFLHLADAASGDELSRYHLEASIAACHARAPTFAATDWRMIVSLYDLLLADFAADVAAVGHAVATGYRDGAEQGLRLLKGLARSERLKDYGPLHAASAEFLAALGRPEEAAKSWRRAGELAQTGPERRYIERRLAALVH